MTKTLLLVSILIPLLGCSTPQKAPPRAPAGFESLINSAAGPSILYQGPFLVGEGAPGRQPAKVFLPIQYDEKPSWPLVVLLLHGFTATGDMENFYLGMGVRTSLRGFILVTPNGTLTPKGTKGDNGRVLDDLPFWNATDACCDFGHTQVDDTAYLTSVISEVKAKYHVDPKRVFVLGHSNGAFMANRLACEIGDQLAGVAALAGGTYKDETKCRFPKAMPYLHIHAQDDTTINYGDAPEYAGGTATVSQWLKRNNCKMQSTKGKDADYLVFIPGNDTGVQQWKCLSQNPVEFWTINKADKDTNKNHNPHIPLFNLNFTDRVLDFLFAQKKAD